MSRRRFLAVTAASQSVVFLTATLRYPLYE